MAIQIKNNQIVDNIITSAKVANAAITPAKCDLSQVYAFTALPTVNADPSAANDLCRKSYVDSLIQGLHWHESVRCRVAANVDISGPGSTLDGLTMASGQRVLLVAQTTAAENGIYDYNGAASAMTRSSDADAYTELNGAAVFIREGTSADTGYTQTAELTSFSSQVWALFTATAGGRQAGAGLSLASNTLSCNVDNSSIEINGSDNLAIKANGVGTTALGNGVVTNAKLANDSITVTAGSGISGGGACALGASVSVSVNLNGSSLHVSGSGLKIADDGVQSAHIADSAVVSAAIADGSVVLDKLSNLSSAQILVGSAGNRPAAVSVSGDISISNSGATSIQSNAVQTAMVANSAITNAKLASSALSITAGSGLSGGGSISLGGSGSIAVLIDGSTLSSSGSGIKIADGGVGSSQIGSGVINAAHLSSGSVETAKIANLAVSGAKVADDTLGLSKQAWRPGFDALTGNAATKYDLSQAVDPDFFKRVQVFRNGLRCKWVASSPADSSEYSVANDGSAGITAVTFGAAPNGDSVMIDFLY